MSQRALLPVTLLLPKRRRTSRMRKSILTRSTRES